jgi:hypothetical protein
LYESCISLSNGKRNAICTSRRRVVGMWLYNQEWQRPKWKDLKTSNVGNPCPSLCKWGGSKKKY